MKSVNKQPDKIKILYLCTQNSSRSQMAEGLTNYYFKDIASAFSAGTNPTEVNSLAIQAMKEIGIDISKQHSKDISAISDLHFDYAITLCKDAQNACPVYLQANETQHFQFEDPARSTGSINERLSAFRKIREQLKETITGFIKDNINIKNGG